MITKGVDLIIIAPIDGEALTDVVEKEHNQDIPIIAYDRLIMNTENVDCYVTFDNFSVGKIQGQYPLSCKTDSFSGVIGRPIK